MLFNLLENSTLGILVPIVTVIMVFSIPIVSIIMEGVEKKSRMKVLEEALKQGVPLEDLPLSESADRLPYRSGMVCLAVGAGIGVFGLSLSAIMYSLHEPDYSVPSYIFIGMGAIVGLIGAALLINDYMHRDRLYRHLEKSEERNAARRIG